MRKLRTAELFAGFQSFSKVMEKHGHATYTIDNDPAFESSFTGDILKLPDNLFVDLDLLWASPPCQGFSVMNIAKNWFHDGTPKTESARMAMTLVKKTFRIIKKSEPKWWFIENPRDKLRSLSFMERFLKQQGGVRRTIWYCHYGDDRAKPTDVWTNAHWWTPRPECHNRQPDHMPDCCCMDHEAASRGSKTGTQGKAGAAERGRIPAAVFEEILAQMPKV